MPHNVGLQGGAWVPRPPLATTPLCVVCVCVCEGVLCVCECEGVCGGVLCVCEDVCGVCVRVCVGTGVLCVGVSVCQYELSTTFLM